MTALLTTIALAAGWYTARLVRAHRDLGGAKRGVTQARKVRAVEAKSFAAVAGIVVVLVWWWLHIHA